MIEQFVESVLGFKKTIAVAAFLGALVSMKYVAPEGWYSSVRGWVSTGYLVICGWLFAAHLAPAVGDWHHLSPTVENGVAFLLGLFGMSMAGAISASLRDSKLADLLRAIVPWKKG